MLERERDPPGRQPQTIDASVSLVEIAPTILRAARLIRSASATEVPPNFMTTVSFSIAAEVTG